MVTYREAALLYQPNVSSFDSQTRVASVIAHELAHQWFGNLVTMEWWTDLWLNEGFATYVSTLGVRNLHPEWNSFDEESLINLLDIFEFDALQSSHPVSVVVTNTDEISQIFDFISYKKGSNVIRMMHLFLGERSFRDGINHYLKEFAYKNAEQNNLWDALCLMAHKYQAIPQHIMVPDIMNSWTLTTGYPLITVTRDYKRRTAQITQKRYLSQGSSTSESEKVCWWIPLSYTTSVEMDFETTLPKNWMECDTRKQALEKIVYIDVGPSDWVIFNIGISGLYKVQYDQQNWELLIKFLNGPRFKEISVMNRAQLVADALDLAW